MSVASIFKKKRNVLHHTNDIANAKKEIDYNCEVDPDKIMDRIYACRLQMMRSQPFYSTIALRITYVEDETIPTAAVDGRRMIYNRHFINALNDSELLFLMAHEIMHLVLRHLTRRGRRDPSLYNSAADYVINYILVRDGVGSFPQIGGLYDNRFADMFTEEVYSILEKEAQDSGGGGGSGGTNFDQHVILDPDGNGNSDSNSQSGDGDDGGSGEGIIKQASSQEEIDEIEADMVSAVIEGIKAQQMRGAGNMPGEITTLIDEFTTPRVNWRSILPELANGQVSNNYTRSKPNRRFAMAQYGVAIPTLYSEDHVEFTLAIDTSGSISVPMLQDFMGEVYGVMETYSSFTVHVWCFDTKVYNHQVFTQDDIDDLLSYEIVGRGGTNFMANWEYMEEIDHIPRTFIMLTDGQPWDSWGDEDYCDTIFVIHDETVINRRIQAPFGQTLYFDDFE